LPVARCALPAWAAAPLSRALFSMALAAAEETSRDKLFALFDAN